MYVKVDLGYRVAYLVDDEGVTQLAASGVTPRLGLDDALASWGYALTPSHEWELTDILNAVDAVRHLVEPVGVRVTSAH